MIMRNVGKRRSTPTRPKPHTKRSQRSTVPTDDARKPREFILSAAKDGVVGVRLFCGVHPSKANFTKRIRETLDDEHGSTDVP